MKNNHCFVVITNCKSIGHSIQQYQKLANINSIGHKGLKRNHGNVVPKKVSGSTMMNLSNKDFVEVHSDKPAEQNVIKLADNNNEKDHNRAEQLDSLVAVSAMVKEKGLEPFGEVDNVASILTANNNAQPHSSTTHTYVGSKGVDKSSANAYDISDRYNQNTKLTLNNTFVILDEDSAGLDVVATSSEVLNSEDTIQCQTASLNIVNLSHAYNSDGDNMVQCHTSNVNHRNLVPSVELINEEELNHEVAKVVNNTAHVENNFNQLQPVISHMPAPVSYSL